MVDADLRHAVVGAFSLSIVQVNQVHGITHRVRRIIDGRDNVRHVDVQPVVVQVGTLNSLASLDKEGELGGVARRRTIHVEMLGDKQITARLDGGIGAEFVGVDIGRGLPADRGLKMLSIPEP